MLEILGYQVTMTQDGAEALTEYRGALRSPSPFVAAILDLTIPLGMGGVETAMQIRKLHPDAVLIAASGYADDPVMAHPKVHGFTERIVKPFLRRDLEDLLNRLFPLGPKF
jgi:CheY-like chemotaxis protein